MISPRRLCRAADGRVVEADDLAAAFLLVCEGGVVAVEDREDVAAYLSIDVPAEGPDDGPTVTFGKAKEPEAVMADAGFTAEEAVEIVEQQDPPVAKRTRKPKG